MLDHVAFQPIARSLTSGKTPVNGIARLASIDEMGTLNLRLPDAATREMAGVVLDLEIPVLANRFTSQGEATVFWLGPDEWLLEVPRAGIAEAAERLRAALAGCFATITEVSDQSIAIEVSGVGARRVLEKGCPLDLHPRAFGFGHCAESHFLQAALLIFQPAADRYLLRVRRSMSEYLWDALSDAIAKG